MAGAFVFQGRKDGAVDLEYVIDFVKSFTPGASAEKLKQLNSLLAQMEAIKKEEGSLTPELAQSVRDLIAPKAFELIGERKLLEYLNQVIAGAKDESDSDSDSGAVSHCDVDNFEVGSG